MNSTVVCRDGPCGEVFGTVMYNLSSEFPDTPVNETEGDVPLFIQESPANAIKSCGEMLSGDQCQLNWTINATGGIDTGWEVGVLFNSSYSDILDNFTDNVTVSILNCTIDFTVQWGSVNFGSLSPNTGPWEAVGNSGNEYNITVNPGSCNLDFYINGTNLTNTTLGYQIWAENVKWSNTSNSFAESYNLTTTSSVLKLDVPKLINVTTWYWINVPPVYAGYYNGTVFIYGVENGQSPP